MTDYILDDILAEFKRQDEKYYDELCRYYESKFDLDI